MKDSLIIRNTEKGIPVYFSPGDADLVSYRVIVKAGSRYEPVDGISHIMEHMSFKGTESRSKDDILASVDSYGGEFNAFTGNDWICYEVSGHSSGAEELYDIITDMVCNPSILESELEPEKKVILQEMSMRDNNPQMHFFMNSVSALWRGTELEHRIIGDEDSVNSVDADILRKFHKSMFVGSNIAVIASGNIGLDTISKMTDSTIGSLDSGKRSVTPKPVMNRGTVYHETSPTNKTCYVSFAFPAVVTEEEAESLDILSTVLSDGLSSRIYKELRDRRALIYNAIPPYIPYLGCSMFAPGFVATPKNVKEAVGALSDVLMKVKDEGITETELRNAKMKNSVTIQSYSESTNNRVRLMLNDYMMWEKVHTMEEREKLADSVTMDSVRAVAEKVMRHDRMHLCIYGTEDDGMKDIALDEISI